jgi:hypothetical protein
VLIPDRLPSLILLVCAWIPPATAGWAAAKFRERARPLIIYFALAAVTLLWVSAWYYVQLDRIPPYLPGATEDPTHAPPEAVRGLRYVAVLFVLPISAVACAVIYRVGITRTNSDRPSS